jgi:hypothetical protein
MGPTVGFFGRENNRVPRPGMTGVRRSEVKEEGRSQWSRSASAFIRPGGHEQRRTHGILGSQRRMDAGFAMLNVNHGPMAVVVAGRGLSKCSGPVWRRAVEPQHGR